MNKQKPGNFFGRHMVGWFWRTRSHFSTCSLPCRKTSSQNSFIAPVSTQSKIAPDHTPTHNGGVVTVTKNREEQDVFTDTQVSETTFSSN